jgi:hypothetical protein
LASSFAIQLALRTSAIFRLADTLAGISDYLQQYVQLVVELCNPEHNFDKLRKHLEEHPAPGTFFYSNFFLVFGLILVVQIFFFWFSFQPKFIQDCLIWGCS